MASKLPRGSRLAQGSAGIPLAPMRHCKTNQLCLLALLRPLACLSFLRRFALVVSTGLVRLVLLVLNLAEELLHVPAGCRGAPRGISLGCFKQHSCLTFISAARALLDLSG